MDNSSIEEKLKVPHQRVEDVYYKFGEAISNLIPFAGSDIFRLVVSPPLERRREKWMEEISKALIELYNRQLIDINTLSSNEEFISLTIETTKVAIAQHEEEKLKFLKNALMNSLLHDLEYDIKFVFIRTIEQLTPRHINVLKYLRNKIQYQLGNYHLYNNIITDLAIQYFDDDLEIAGVFFQDLCQLKLIEVKELHQKLRGSYDSKHYFFNNWGEEFLDFIGS